MIIHFSFAARWCLNETVARNKRVHNQVLQLVKVTGFGFYRGADKSLARQRRKQANVSVRMAWISFGALPCSGEKKKLDDSSRLDVVEIARVSDMLPSLLPSL